MLAGAGFAHVLAVSCHWLYIKSSAHWSPAARQGRGPEDETSFPHVDVPWGGRDSSAWPATVRLKLGINVFTPRTVRGHFSVSLHPERTCPGLKHSGERAGLIKMFFTTALFRWPGFQNWDKEQLPNIQTLSAQQLLLAFEILTSM